MQRHPHYLELPWSIHWGYRAKASATPTHRLWWLIVGLTLLAVFLIGVM